jgi:hypothetical protein
MAEKSEAEIGVAFGAILIPMVSRSPTTQAVFRR